LVHSHLQADLMGPDTETKAS